MQKAHSNINWENYPSEKTAVNKINLNKMDGAIDEIDNRVINLDTTKATKVEVSELFSGVSFDESTGIITFTRKNGSQITIDTKLEKLAINFAYDPVEEELVITLDDGTKQYVDLSALITVYEFLDSDTIAFAVEGGKVKAIVKEGSIQGKHLQPDYLADITIQANIATQKASEASDSAEAAALSQQASALSEQAAKSSETIALQKAGEAADSAAAAASSEQASLQSQQAAALSEQNSAASEQAAKNSETVAAQKASEASGSAASALVSERNSATSASASLTEANRAQTEADRAAQYSSIVAPGFYVDLDSMSLYMKTGVGVDFIVADGNKLCWKIS